MRRPNGSGTIVKLGGNRRKPYAVRIAHRDARNRVIQQYLSYHRTGAEAQAALDDYNNKKEQGLALAADSLNITLGQVYELWSARKYPKANKASIDSYSASWVRLAALSDVKMRKLTIDHLQSIIDEDENNKLSKSSMKNDKTLMRALFKFAMERDIVTKDYSAFVQLPHVEPKYEKNAFTEFQMKQLETMAAAGEPWADTVLMLCYTGFRITEFLTLTRFSYNEKENYLQGGIKTAAGKNRIIPVHPKIKPYLNNWLAKNGDTIICSKAGKRISPQVYRINYFSTVMEKLGIPQATPHWCRHTFSTRGHLFGMPELELKRIMGHADKDITEHYTHTDIQQLRTAINRLA